MAVGRLVQTRDKSDASVIRVLLDRIIRLERRNTLRVGGIGGAIGGNGFTLTIDVNGNLVAVSDSGTTTILAPQ